jgi:hypothetical protein
MQIVSDRTSNGAVKPSWQAVDRRLQRAEREVASHPGIGLLLAALLGIFLAIWIKRK